MLLGRALLHARLVAERNHAVREGLVVDAQAGGHLTNAIDGALRHRLDVAFRSLRGGAAIAPEERAALIGELAALIDPRAAESG